MTNCPDLQQILEDHPALAKLVDDMSDCPGEHEADLTAIACMMYSVGFNDGMRLTLKTLFGRA